MLAARSPHNTHNGDQMQRNRFIAGLLLGAAACTAPLCAQAQAYPTKPIRLVVTFPPGGAPDILARLFGEKAQLGQSIVIDNKPGAGGNLGSDFVAKAPADGQRFDLGDSIGSQLIQWPAEQVVKCLVHYHPDDEPGLRLAQENQVALLWEATRESGHELLLEIIPPPAMTPPGTADAAVLRAVKRFYNLGFKPEWWKLAPMSAAAWGELQQLVAERDPHCRGAVILGLNQPLDDLARGFAQAGNPIVKGFMVGRTLWAAPSLRWLKNEIDDAAFVAAVAANFATLVDAWFAARARA